MSDEIRISGKDLGALSLDSFCSRCFWIKRRLENKLPFQIFPGIFSSIDSYCKDIIHEWVDELGSFPDWLSQLGAFTKYMKPPGYQRFYTVDATYGVRLTGAADGIYLRDPLEYVIVDYKTAKFTDAQDALLPVYITQLNAYALIAENTGIKPVTGLALIYFEPATGPDNARHLDHRRDTGFRLQFNAHVKSITLDKQSIPPLLKRVREIVDLPKPPNGHQGCDDCNKVERLVALIS